MSQVCFAKILYSHFIAQNLIALSITWRTRFLLIYIMSTKIEQLKLESWFFYNVNLNCLGDLPCFWQWEQYLIRWSMICLLMSSWPKRFSTLCNLFADGCLKQRQSQWSSVMVKQQGFWSNKWVINDYSDFSYNKKGWPNWQTTGTDFIGVTKTFLRLL